MDLKQIQNENFQWLRSKLHLDYLDMIYMKGFVTDDSYLLRELTQKKSLLPDKSWSKPLSEAALLCCAFKSSCRNKPLKVF